MKLLLALTLVTLLAGGCAHQVTFDRPPSYAVSEPKLDAAVTVVIEPATLTQKVAIRAWSTGIANSFEAEPGDMLKQVADIEMPQLFSAYQLSTAYAEPVEARGIVLALSVPEYKFEEFRATVAVKATAYDRGRREILQKTYRAEGQEQTDKMVFAGAFGMKSAIRQSSFDAYKKIFAQLRPDLVAAVPK